MASASKRRVALLRGINVGSHRRIGMADLRELLARQGYEDVRTHLQSGNVVLTSSLSADRLGKKLERELEAGLGFPVEVIVRTRAELARIIVAIRSPTWRRIPRATSSPFSARSRQRSWSGSFTTWTSGRSRSR
jgi:uncharacterized protein (DUF1697 family)